jgi:hypothetical protein
VCTCARLADDPNFGPKSALADRARQSFNRSVNAGDGSFNSMSARRSCSAPRSSARGGPGEHDYSGLYGMGMASTSVTSSFASSVPRGAHVRKTDSPGPGSYEPNEGIAGRSLTKPTLAVSTDGHSMFAGHSPQRKHFDESKRTAEHVGPGTYSPVGSIRDDLHSKQNPRLPGFAASNARATSAPRTRSRSPAPGDCKRAASRAPIEPTAGQQPPTSRRTMHSRRGPLAACPTRADEPCAT